MVGGSFGDRDRLVCIVPPIGDRPLFVSLLLLCWLVGIRLMVFRWDCGLAAWSAVVSEIALVD